jgi:hypothetical protein
MAGIGLNHKANVLKSLRNETRALYEGVFGATVKSPRPDLEVFTFADGSGIGVFYVDSAETLTQTQMMYALWLEFEVDDPAATSKALVALGMRPFDYPDTEHEYFQAPGGQVFRLSPVRR